MTDAPSGIKYKRLKQVNPRIDQMRLRILKALYKGGAHLLKDDDVMNAVFPKYTYETSQVYTERRARAFYENLFALVVNQMSAGLAQDPARAVPKIKDPGAQLTPYWTNLMISATAYDEDGSDQRSFDQIMRDLCVEAMVCGWSWIQVEMPTPSENIASRQGQEEAGDLNAYVCAWPTDQVTDWEEKNGRLLWLRTYECTQRAESPTDDRNVKRHTWTIWTAEDWTSYVVDESKSPTDPKKIPAEDDVIEFDDRGQHQFGRVPWIKFDLCGTGAHLHIGDFIESSCRSYFNRVCGESFQWTQYNFQQLYEFLGAEDPGIDTVVPTAQQDPGRATRGKRGPGQIHIRGAEDRAEFIGPDMSGASSGREAIQDQRDSILRMVAQMALSQDTSGAMLRRSGDSKKQDAVGQEILLGSVGKRLLTTTRQVVALIAQIRKDYPEDVPNIEGYARFNVDDADDLIDQGVKLEQVQVPSATYQVERKYRMAITDLGDDADDVMKNRIRDELGQAITQKNLNWTMQPPEDPAQVEE